MGKGIRLFSLNAALWPWDNSAGTMSRVEKMVDVSTNYDVVVLQEAFEMHWCCRCVDKGWPDLIRNPASADQLQCHDTSASAYIQLLNSNHCTSSAAPLHVVHVPWAVYN